MQLHKSRHQDAVERIADWIIAGRFSEAGTLPTEAEVGAELGVSRTVVREAIRTLSAKGLVRARPRHGTAVRPQEDWHLFDPQVIEWRMRSGISHDLANDLIDFRLAIEPFAGQLAAQRSDFPTDDLQAAYEHMVAATESDGAYSDYYAADLDFHQTILTGTKNAFIHHLAPLIANALRLSFHLSVFSMDSARASLPMHKAVAEAIAARAPERASEALTTLIESARGDIFLVLNGAGGSGRS
ncbi:FadR/GntR family transcriptional regulator [Chelativorans sp. YIM 93263]|uniref:FadR/GntR family transcriptional regulator n=1 Tax=Chelativorans sp. YIM 93263 TaxID=2906648 RepID=UPI002378AFB6|nr:FCD domain-containing protein [Chelativorans sp. YIM 93263]